MGEGSRFWWVDEMVSPASILVPVSLGTWNARGNQVNEYPGPIHNISGPFYFVGPVCHIISQSVVSAFRYLTWV